jgi:hypothetical protein
MPTNKFPSGSLARLFLLLWFLLTIMMFWFGDQNLYLVNPTTGDLKLKSIAEPTEKMVGSILYGLLFAGVSVFVHRWVEARIQRRRGKGALRTIDTRAAGSDQDKTFPDTGGKSKDE